MEFGLVWFSSCSARQQTSGRAAIEYLSVSVIEGNWRGGWAGAISHSRRRRWVVERVLRCVVRVSVLVQLRFEEDNFGHIANRDDSISFISHQHRRAVRKHKHTDNATH